MPLTIILMILKSFNGTIIMGPGQYDYHDCCPTLCNNCNSHECVLTDMYTVGMLKNTVQGFYSNHGSPEVIHLGL